MREQPSPSLRINSLAFAAVSVLLGALGAGAAEPAVLSRGQTVYVSVHSVILTGPKASPFALDATLIVRNTDMSRSLTLDAVDFYDTEGKLVRSYLDKPLALAPLETKHFYSHQKGTGGGIGENFIVRWRSEVLMNAPIVECLMIGTRSGQGISFLSPGRALVEPAAP